MYKQHKRITLSENCMGCLACEAACKQEHNLPLGPRWIRVFPDLRETGGRLRLNYLITECEHAGPGPCQVACPAGINVWLYVTLIGLGKFGQALAVIRETTPFAGILGRVCTRPCESVCEQGKIEVPVGIRSLKQFVADYEREVGGERVVPLQRTKDKKVAVIGSGPAGLSCAYDLARKGYGVTVFEAAPKPGGNMRYGIPAFRLPREVVDYEIGYMEKAGVEIKTNTPVRDLEDLFKEGYKSIFVAIGTGVSRKMGIPGEDAAGVLSAMEFLRRLNAGERIEIGERVAVIGGGNTAVDAARAAKRAGAKEVFILYRRTKTEMPAMALEVAEAEHEGIGLNFLVSPRRVVTKGERLSALECLRMELGAPDASGRRSPVPIEGSEFLINVDTALVAVGESMDKDLLPRGLTCNSRGNLYVNPETLQTNMAGVFAGGDAVTGPKDIIWAIAEGKEAALAVDSYLRGAGTMRNPSFGLEMLRPAAVGKTRDIVIRDARVAQAEASRCFNCGICGAALDSGLQTACVRACPAHCIYFGDIWELTPKTETYRVK